MQKERLKHTKALLAGVFAGIVSPASIGAPVEYPRLAGSDLSRMRGDAARVGRDFNEVVNAKKAAAQRGQAG